MSIRPYDFDDVGRVAYQVTIAFLQGRLDTAASIEWALKLHNGQRAERAAIIALLNATPAAERLEPWASAWRLIEEYWDEPDEDTTAVSSHGIKQRLSQGDRSNALISTIMRLVRPRLKINARGTTKGKKPKTVHEVISISFTSNEPVDPSSFGLNTVKDVPFLSALAAALEVAVSENINKGTRLGWGRSLRWRLGDVRRVYYAKPDGDDNGDRENEPDEFGRGIAFATKVLHAAVRRLATLDRQAAQQLCARWRDNDSSIFMRLWAAMARDGKLVPASDAEQFLMKLGDEPFWDTNSYPEIAEMRAVRFSSFSPAAQKALADRIRKLPPKHFWKGENLARVRGAREYWGVREFRRLQGAGGVLSVKHQEWTDAMSATIPDLAKSIPTTWGFLGGMTVRSANPKPDSKFDILNGVPRLKELESALAAGRQHWDDDPSERASAWIRTGGNSSLLVADFEVAGAQAKDFPLVWDRFGWTHGTAERGPDRTLQKSAASECRRVIALVLALPDSTISAAIDGLTHWINAWEDLVVLAPKFVALWRKAWPLAVQATNAREPSSESFELTAVVGAKDDGETRDLDTLNTPAGRMVGVFIAAWRATKKGTNPFAAGSKLSRLRNEVIQADGRAGLIAKHRLIELISYFHHTDSVWTKSHLLPHLTADTPGAASLWRAVSRRRLDGPILRLLKPAILQRVNDVRLGRTARQALVFSIVVDTLHALLREKAPAIKPAHIQQMLRAADDEIRAHAADTVSRFVRDNAPSVASDVSLVKAAAPFMETIWPQERQLTTPSTSKALADLPAISGKAFVKAVTLIERFLVPFDCWSMLEYGLWGDEKDRPKLANIDTTAKAKAFLHLLDLTVGANQGAVVPYDLGEALGRISEVSPPLAEQPAYRRLSAAAR